MLKYTLRIHRIDTPTPNEFRQQCIHAQSVCSIIVNVQQQQTVRGAQVAFEMS